MRLGELFLFFEREPIGMGRKKRSGRVRSTDRFEVFSLATLATIKEGLPTAPFQGRVVNAKRCIACRRQEMLPPFCPCWPWQDGRPSFDCYILVTLFELSSPMSAAAHLHARQHSGRRAPNLGRLGPSGPGQECQGRRVDTRNCLGAGRRRRVPRLVRPVVRHRQGRAVRRPGRTGPDLGRGGGGAGEREVHAGRVRVQRAGAREMFDGGYSLARWTWDCCRRPRGGIWRSPGGCRFLPQAIPELLHR